MSAPIQLVAQPISYVPIKSCIRNLYQINSTKAMQDFCDRQDLVNNIDDWISLLFIDNYFDICLKLVVNNTQKCDHGKYGQLINHIYWTMNKTSHISYQTNAKMYCRVASRDERDLIKLLKKIPIDILCTKCPVCSTYSNVSDYDTDIVIIDKLIKSKHYSYLDDYLVIRGEYCHNFSIIPTNQQVANILLYHGIHYLVPDDMIATYKMQIKKQTDIMKNEVGDLFCGDVLQMISEYKGLGTVKSCYGIINKPHMM
jgi:hypothetical protein